MGSNGEFTACLRRIRLSRAKNESAARTRAAGRWILIQCRPLSIHGNCNPCQEEAWRCAGISWGKRIDPDADSCAGVPAFVGSALSKTAFRGGDLTPKEPVLGNAVGVPSVRA